MELPETVLTVNCHSSPQQRLTPNWGTDPDKLVGRTSAINWTLLLLLIVEQQHTYHRKSVLPIWENSRCGSESGICKAIWALHAPKQSPPKHRLSRGRTSFGSWHLPQQGRPASSHHGVLPPAKPHPPQSEAYSPYPRLAGRVNRSPTGVDPKGSPGAPVSAGG